MKIGTTELLIILAIILLVFGPSQIPKLSRMFGKSVKSFQKGMTEDSDETPSAASGQEKDTL